MEPDESAVDFSAADFATDGGPMSSTFSAPKTSEKPTNPNTDLDKTSGIKTNTEIDDSYNDTTVMDQTVDKTACETINKTADMTAGCGIQGDMDYTNDETAMDVSEAGVDNGADDSEVTMNLDKTGGVACGKTFNADQTEDVTMDETAEENDNKTIDQTNGVGCGATFNVTNDVTTLDDTEAEESSVQPEAKEMPKPSLPKPVLEAVVISSDEEDQVKTADDSEVVCMGEANDSVDIYAKDPEDGDGTEEFDTAIEEGQTPPPPVVDITEPTPRKENVEKMPTPDFGPRKVKFTLTDISKKQHDRHGGNVFLGFIRRRHRIDWNRGG